MRVGDVLQTVELAIEGPAAVIESVSHQFICDEDKNRAVIVQTDETPSQTKRVLAATAERYVAVGHCDVEQIRQKHWTMQRLLEPRPVVIPWAPALAERFPANRVESRRAFPRVLWVVQAAALLRQRQPGRQKGPQGELIASIDDYRVARGLLAPWLAVELGGGVCDAAKRLWEHAQKHGATFTRKEAEAWMGVGARQANRWLSELVEANLLRRQAERGQAAEYDVIPDVRPEDVSLLAAPEELEQVAGTQGWTTWTGLDKGPMSNPERT